MLCQLLSPSAAVLSCVNIRKIISVTFHRCGCATVMIEIMNNSLLATCVTRIDVFVDKFDVFVICQ